MSDIQDFLKCRERLVWTGVFRLVSAYFGSLRRTDENTESALEFILQFQERNHLEDCRPVDILQAAKEWNEARQALKV